MNENDPDATPSVDRAWIDDLEARSNLTRSQFLIWMGQKIAPKAPLYNMAFAFRLRGTIDEAAFRGAFAALVRGCDALRTVIEEHDGVPTQRIADDVEVALEAIDLSGEADPQDAYRRWLERRAGRMLILGERLYDAALITLADDDRVWYLNQHHIITDAWSSMLLARQMSALYAQALNADDASDLPALPSFARYAERERERRDAPATRRARAYWERKIEDAAPATSFYGRRPARSGSRTQRVRVRLGAQRSDALKRIAAEKGVRLVSDDLSLFCVFVALMLAYLRRIGGQRRLSLGAPFHNRSTSTWKATPGLFIEVFPLAVEVDDDATFASLLKTVARELMDVLANATPGVSTAASNRAYDVLLNFLNVRMPRIGGLDTSTEWVHAGAGDSQHKLRLQVHDFDGSGDLELLFDLNRSVFGSGEQSLAVEHFLRTVDAFISDRSQRLDDIDLASADTLHRMLVDFNDTVTEYPTQAPITALFEEQVARAPLAPAVRRGDQVVSYRDLDRRSTRLAARLTARGAGPGSLVPICLERDVDAIVALIAVLKTGAAYVPLDPRHPRRRHDLILSDLSEAARGATPLVITQASLASRFADSHLTLLCVDDEAGADVDLKDPATPAGGEALAYVIYTSGSTGRPKGTLIPQRALVNYACWARAQYCGDAQLSFALHSSLAVDLTVTSIFVPLISGGTIVVYPDEGENDLPILRVFEEDAVDVLKLTPAHLALVREMGGRAQRIRTLILGGEDLRSELVEGVLRQFPEDMRLFNEYGPTEATVGCMIHRYDANTDVMPSVPIGRPVGNARIYVLDEHLRATPPGIVGEICIGGPGVARGYLGRGELTTERFVEDPLLPGAYLYRTGDLARWNAASRIEFLGRDDHQIKIRGARIELAEVEAAITSHPSIGESVVTVIGGREQRIQQCAKCGIPSNYPDISFDDDGVCSMCIAFDRLEDRAQNYFGDLDELRALAARMKAERRGKYDCVVLLSGGKDSTYMIYQVAALGLKVLAFTLDNGFISEGALENVRRTVRDLGIDHEIGSTPHMNEIFNDSLQRFSNVCHGCFKTIYTLSMQLARKHDTGYIMTGLSRGQIFETRLHDLFRHRIFDARAIEQAIMEARKVYHRIDDAVSRTLDVEGLFRDDAIFEAVQFVDYYRYHDVGLDEVYRFLSTRAPWVRPSDTGRSTNCLINDAGIFVHKNERGYHNYALPYSWDVRLGHKSRAAALDELDDEIDTRRVRRILEEVGYEVKPPVNDTRLVAYYSSPEAVPVAQLRSYLGERLQDEMIPAHLVHLRQLPLTQAGKVDRNKLPAPNASHSADVTAYVEPDGELEESLAAIWKELLQVERVGANDNFFDLGGMSLSAIQAMGRVREAFAVELPIQSFFSAPTVREVANQVEDLLIAQIEAMSSDEVRDELGGERHA